MLCLQCDSRMSSLGPDGLGHNNEKVTTYACMRCNSFVFKPMRKGYFYFDRLGKSRFLKKIDLRGGRISVRKTGIKKVSYGIYFDERLLKRMK